MKLVTAAVCAMILWVLQDVLYYHLWRRGLKVRLSFSRAAATEGERLVLQETVVNAKALPLPVLHVKFQMGRDLVFTSAGNSKITDHNYRSDIFSCLPWQEIRRNLEFTCRKRGCYTISQVHLVSYDLFFSGHLVATLPADASLYVYPRPVSFERLQLPFCSLMGQFIARSSLLQDPFETQSVRPYQSYDPYRAINWKATARTGELKVNVYAPTTSWQVMFLLDMDSDRIWKDGDLTEEAIRLCGSYSRLLIEEGIPVSVRTNGIDCLTGHRGYSEAGAGRHHIRTIMELLARVRPDDSGDSPMEAVFQELTETLRTAGPAGSRDSLICILISPKQRPSMAQAFASLCRYIPGCQWILPLRPGQEFTMDTAISVFPWEVPYDYSQAS